MLEIEAIPFKKSVVVAYWAISISLIFFLYLLFIVLMKDTKALYYFLPFVIAMTLPLGVFLLMTQKIRIDPAEKSIVSCFGRFCVRNFKMKDIAKIKYGRDNRGGLSMTIYLKNGSLVNLASWRFEEQDIKFAIELMLSLSDTYGFEVEEVKEGAPHHFSADGAQIKETDELAYRIK